MKSGLLYLRPARLTLVRVTGPYATTIPAAWEKMFAWLDKHGFNSSFGRGYGLARDNPNIVGADKCRYDACVELEPIFEERAIRELGVQTLPGGSYVRERRTGGYDLYNQDSTFHAAFEVPSGLMLDDKRPVVTIYLDDPRRIAAAELRSDFCVPVKAKTARCELEAA